MIEGQEAPPGLPRSIRKLDGRWFGDARIILEGIELRLIYFGINEHHRHGLFPMHSHPFSEIFCCISGRGRITARGRSVGSEPGSVFLALPGERHASAWNCPGDSPWTGFIVQFDMEIPSEALARDSDLRLSQSTAAFYRYFFLEKQGFHSLAPPVFRMVNDAFRHLRSSLNSHPGIGHAAVASFWLEFLALVSHSIQESAGVDGRGVILDWSDKEKRLLHARHLLCLEENRDVAISAIARRAGMSEYHFIRSFRETFGISPMRYRASVVMQRAARLLAQSDLPVEDIAHQVGYGSAQSFSRAFRRQYGLSPREYRRLHAVA